MSRIVGNEETERIAALHHLCVLDTPPEQTFDEIAQLAAALCGVSISLISLTDTDRQWFKARVGMDITETSRERSFCAHAILQKQVFIVPDASRDSRFSNNPFFRQDPPLRFYAGVPLITTSGHVLGTLCVLDTRPRVFSADKQNALQVLARQVVAQLELRRRIAEDREGLNIKEAAHRSESRFRALSNTAPIGIFETDRQGNCVYTNSQWQQMTGLTLEASLGTGWWNAVHPDDRDDVSTVWGICAEQGHDFYMEFRFLRPKGQVRWVRSHAAAVYSDTGEITGYIGADADITEYKQYQLQIEEQVMYIQENSLQLERQKCELEALNTKLQALAVTDGLTGLKNHRAFQERFAEEFERSQRYHTPMSLLLLDVDRFKHFNDTYGHPAGDQVLKMVAKLLEETVRTSDYVARYGGEEFVILLPETDTEGAAHLAERVRQAVASHPWPNRQVTISIGASTLRPGCAAPSELIGQADQALYSSKTDGRNRVTLYVRPHDAPGSEAAHAPVSSSLQAMRFHNGASLS